MSEDMCEMSISWGQKAAILNIQTSFADKYTGNDFDSCVPKYTKYLLHFRFEYKKYE